MKGKLHQLISVYANWVIQNYRLIEQVNSANPSLKIVKCPLLDQNENMTFTVQLSGKNLFTKISAIELFKNKSIFENFSEEDQQKIVDFLPQQPNTILQKVLTRTYDRFAKQVYFTIKPTLSNKVELLSAPEIIAKFKDLKGFATQDALLIGIELGKAWAN